MTRSYQGSDKVSRQRSGWTFFNEKKTLRIWKRNWKERPLLKRQGHQPNTGKAQGMDQQHLPQTVYYPRSNHPQRDAWERVGLYGTSSSSGSSRFTHSKPQETECTYACEQCAFLTHQMTPSGTGLQRISRERCHAWTTYLETSRKMTKHSYFHS